MVQMFAMELAFEIQKVADQPYSYTTPQKTKNK